MTKHNKILLGPDYLSISQLPVAIVVFSSSLINVKLMVDRQVVMQGLQLLVRLMRHHHETVQAHLHAIIVAVAKQVRNLRSQVARAACQASGELFLLQKRAMENVSINIIQI